MKKLLNRLKLGSQLSRTLPTVVILAVTLAACGGEGGGETAGNNPNPPITPIPAVGTQAPLNPPTLTEAERLAAQQAQIRIAQGQQAVDTQARLVGQQQSLSEQRQRLEQEQAVAQASIVEAMRAHIAANRLVVAEGEQARIEREQQAERDEQARIVREQEAQARVAREQQEQQREQERLAQITLQEEAARLIRVQEEQAAEQLRRIAFEQEQARIALVMEQERLDRERQQAAAQPLTAQQILALAPQEIGAVPAPQIGVLTPAEVGLLSVAQVKALTREQLLAFSAEQIAGLRARSIQALASVESRASFRDLSEAQLSLINADQHLNWFGAVSQLSLLEQAECLTADQAQQLLNQGLRDWNLPQVWLKIYGHRIGRKMGNQRPGDAQNAERLFKEEMTHIANFTAEQIRAIRVDQMQYIFSWPFLQLEQVPYWTAEQLMALSADQLNLFTPEQLMRLSDEQRNVMEVAPNSILRDLDHTKVAAILRNAPVSMDAPSLAVWGQAIENDQIATFPRLQTRFVIQQLAEFSVEHLRALTPVQMGLFAPREVQTIPNDLIPLITVEQLRAIDLWSLRFTLDQLPQLTVVQLQAFTRRMILSLFATQYSSPAARNALSLEQLAAFQVAELAQLSAGELERFLTAAHMTAELREQIQREVQALRPPVAPAAAQ